MDSAISPAAIALLGAFLLTIHHAGMAQQPLRPADSSGAAVIQILEQGRPVERRLAAGETHSYQVRLESGQFLRAVVDQRGIDLVVSVFAPDGGRVDEIDSPNGDQGPEPIALEAKQSGLYRIDVTSLDSTAPPGRYEIRIEELVIAPEYRARQAAERERRRAVVTWLRENAIPIRSVTAGSGFADLQPLKKILKDVRIVGLGEATHGTREFFQFKHRMLEFLVREMGFRLFAIEASHAGCIEINEYIMGRSDDGARALDAQGFWTWNTEEVRAMIDWMRAYNGSVPAGKRVKFVGYDLQFNGRGREVVLAYLRRVAPERVAGYEALPSPAPLDRSGIATALEGLVERASGSAGEERETAMARLIDIRARYNELIGFLLLNQSRFTHQTSAAEFASVLEHARMIAQYLDAYTPGPVSTVSLRDEYMAENIERLIGGEPAGTRVVVWAHNGHISTGDEDGRYRHMGWYLRRTFAEAYYALGFSFNRGGFQSRDMDPKADVAMALTGFTVGPAADGSIDWYLAQTGIAHFLVDLRTPIRNDVVAAWRATPAPMRSVGSAYFVNGEAQFYGPVTLGREFDGLVFFDTTSRARPNRSVRNVRMEK